MWHKDKKWTNTVGKNGTNRCVWCRVVINLQFVKKKKKKSALSETHNKMKCNKMRRACTMEHYLDSKEKAILSYSTTPWWHYSMWNKTLTKSQTLKDPMYMRYLK